MNHGQAFYLVDDREVVISEDIYICCDGGVSGGLGHPREYMTLTRGGENRCGYCSRLFIHVGHPDEAVIRETGILQPDVVAAA